MLVGEVQHPGDLVGGGFEGGLLVKQFEEFLLEMGLKLALGDALAGLPLAIDHLHLTLLLTVHQLILQLLLPSMPIRFILVEFAIAELAGFVHTRIRIAVAVWAVGVVVGLGDWQVDELGLGGAVGAVLAVGAARALTPCLAYLAVFLLVTLLHLLLHFLTHSNFLTLLDFSSLPIFHFPSNPNTILANFNIQRFSQRLQQLLFNGHGLLGPGHESE